MKGANDHAKDTHDLVCGAADFTADARWRALAPTQARLAYDPDAWRAFYGLDDAKYLRRPKGTVVLNKARREVDHPKRTGGGFEMRLQDIGVVYVGLLADLAIGGTDQKPAALFFIE